MLRNRPSLRTSSWFVVFAAVAALATAPAVVDASGGGGGGGMSGGMGGGMSGGMSGGSSKKTPAEIAQARYEKGLKQRDYALDYERKASETDPGWWQSRYIKGAKKYWGRAIDSYKEAISNKPDFYQAYSDLGFAYRKTGDYDKSLAAYQRALKIRPGYTRALEYLGEAYLGLDRLEDAKELYMRLFVLDRELAAELMTAMSTWVEDPEHGADQETFRSWVEERRALAEQTGDDEVSEASSW